MRFSSRRGLSRWVVFLALVTALAATGCGPSTATVSGKVTYQGNELKGGNITFLPAAGKGTVSSAIGLDGSYKLAKVPTGPVKIIVETESQNPARRARIPTQAQRPPNSPNAPPDPAELAKRYVKIPPQYAQESLTDLTYTVTPGPQEHNVVLP